MIGRWQGLQGADERTLATCAETCAAEMARLIKVRNDANRQLLAKRREWRYLMRVAVKFGVTLKVRS